MDEQTQAELSTTPRRDFSALKSLVAAAVGVATQLLLLLILGPLQPRSVLDHGTLPTFPGLPGVCLKGLQWLQAWPQSLLVFLVFLVLAVRKRQQKLGWTYAFVAGAFIPVLLHQFFSHI